MVLQFITSFHQNYGYCVLYTRINAVYALLYKHTGSCEKDIGLFEYNFTIWQASALLIIHVIYQKGGCSFSIRVQPEGVIT